jgi:putative transposase
MMQIARNLTDPVDGFISGKRIIIIDRDRKYCDAFRLPPRSPNLNAWVERFVRSIKEECLSKMIFFGERSLHRAIKQYLAHYHAVAESSGTGQPADRTE